eukprot:gnl/TRDRNA2_/TRDRNA2_190056_c0_seq1.p1 gnl/TRDRNA2_/TRDRNA2_190056_c0~~gnl/TRDRNA2_/TRDRNA2_190056_c0_seq1.p1  ORF type:complete len:151 (-),score=33.51 gnl/TRDRNA2_/TRDRNA2_190056_c0_seq1:57-509(-)
MGQACCKGTEDGATEGKPGVLLQGMDQSAASLAQEAQGIEALAATKAKVPQGKNEFEATITKREGSILGIEVDAMPQDGDSPEDAGTLLVVAVSPEGLVPSWNKTVPESSRITAGVRILSINSTSAPQEMIAECRSKEVLKLKCRAPKPN